MARPRSFELVLTNEERAELQKVANSRSEELRKVTRSKIMLMYEDGVSNTDIAKQLGIDRLVVQKTMQKCRAFGPIEALNDLPRPGRPCVIDGNDKAYVAHLACCKPVDFGYSEELWTIELLRRHIRNHCVEDHYPNLRNVSKSTVHDILDEMEIKPHRITYYLENRDPEFKEKMDRLLILYKQIQVTIDSGEEPDMPTFSFDEKPGIQILEGTAPDLMPDPEKGHACVARDYEYIRHGTLSLLAGLNLNDGTVVPLVRRTHTSRDFIDFLDILDKKYPQYSHIRVILDNHSAHRSKEVMEYLKTKQDRFVFVFTPKHGSWLNLIESFFGKMAKTMLRGIRASSYDELADRIYKYIDRVNEEPVVYRWTYKMDEIEV